MTRFHYRGRRRQHGVTLMVVLILLLVLTLLALASVRGTLLEQFMSTSQMDRGMSFQSAEAALREAEARAASKPAPPGSNSCSDGVCDAPLPTATPRWLDTEANWTSFSKAASAIVGTNTAAPRYIIEVMAIDARPGSNCTTSGDVSPDAACSEWESLYRITARSSATDRSDVVLQSTLAVP